MKREERQEVARLTAYLNAWAHKVLRPVRTRRLSLSEAYLAAQQARLRYRVTGHY